MSYVMQGAQRLGRSVAFGAVEPTDGWFVHGDWTATIQGIKHEGHQAHPEPRPGVTDPTVAEWIANKCAEGSLVYRSAPVEMFGKKTFDLYASAEPLKEGFTTWPGRPPLEPHACPTPEGKSKHLIFGAMALVAAAGGFYLYRKRPR